MNEQPPERARRRLRDPDEATPPPSRPAPRRIDPRDPRASGYQELPPSRHSGQHELPQPSRRARPGPGAPGATGSGPPTAPAPSR